MTSFCILCFFNLYFCVWILHAYLSCRILPVTSSLPAALRPPPIPRRQLLSEISQLKSQVWRLSFYNMKYICCISAFLHFCIFAFQGRFRCFWYFMRVIILAKKIFKIDEGIGSFCSIWTRCDFETCYPNKSPDSVPFWFVSQILEFLQPHHATELTNWQKLWPVNNGVHTQVCFHPHPLPP